MLTSPDEFARTFAQAVSAQDPAALLRLMAEDVQGLTLGGHWVEGRSEADEAWSAELAGLLARVRLVSGRLSLKMLGPSAAVLSQRYVISGAQAAEGVEMQRFPAMLTAVLTARPEGWVAMTLSLSAVSD